MRRRAEVAAAAYGVALYRPERGKRAPDRRASLKALVVDEVSFVWLRSSSGGASPSAAHMGLCPLGQTTKTGYRHLNAHNGPDLV